MDASNNDLAGSQVLVIDDVPANQKLLCDTLEFEGYTVSAALSGEVGLKVARADPPALILLDIMMPGIDGYEVCRRLKSEDRLKEIPVIFITANSETSSLVEGFRVGGVDYITKPFQPEEVLIRVHTHLENARLNQLVLKKNKELEAKNEQLRKEIDRREKAEASLETADEQLSLISHLEAERWGIAHFVGRSERLGKVWQSIQRLQQAANTTVLITGESGTGKELVARAIHFGSSRAKAPFLPVNCAAIPNDLAESLLFGHVRGAFSGAQTDQKGYFELAHRGTLFLDEIGDMPLALQAKLLRVLETGSLRPVGATEEKSVEVRILAATNAELQTRRAVGAFRQDLYYRLAHFVLHVPPLRERPEDIPVLVRHFLKMFASEMGRQPSKLGTAALDALSAYPFPGNVRELKSIVERAIIESGGTEIQTGHLHLPLGQPAGMALSAETASESAVDLPLNLENAQRQLAQRALAQCQGNMSKAAERLGINRTKLYRLLAKGGRASV